MQIEVHDVDAEIAGARDAHQRVHVGAVHVNLRAFGVQDFRDARDVLFEYAERVGIGDHQRGDVFIHRARERFHIHHAALVRLDIFHLVSGHRRRGGIGAVRGIRDQEFLARIALRFEQRADQQNPGELAVRAGGRLQRDRIHAGDFGENRFERPHYFENALRERFRLIRMRPRQAFDARHLLIHARIVFHGAGAQRIKAEIDGVVLRGEAREVTDRLHLAHFGKALDFGARVASAQRGRRIDGGNIQGREADSRVLPGELFSNSSGSF